MLLDRFFSLLDFRFDFGSFSAPFWVVFGRPNGPLEVSEKGANRPLGEPQDGLGVVLVRFLVRLAVWDRFCTLFGPSWEHFWPLVVPCLLEANFRFVGAVLVSLFGFGDRCSFATCPFAFERLPISRLSMSLVSLPFVVHRLSLFDLSIVLLVPGPCGLRAARLQ